MSEVKEVKKVEIDVEAIAKQLSLKYNCKINPIIFQETEESERIIGYIKEPTRMVKARTLDTAANGAITAALNLFEATLLKEESDPRFSSDKSEHDDIVLGGALVTMSTIQIRTNAFIKK